MNATDEATFQATMNRFLTGMDTAAQTSGHLPPDDLYAPISVTTDGWKAAQKAWESKEKQVLFTNHLKYDQAPAYSAPLDRSMRFLDGKLQVSGQYRVADAINPMLNAWAIVNN